MSILAHPVGILAFITGYFAKSVYAVYASRLDFPNEVEENQMPVGCHK